jgi:aconitate hydratase
LPLTFADPSDYDKINEGDNILLSDIFTSINAGRYTLYNKNTGVEIKLECTLSERQIDIMLAGGLIALTAKGQK